MASGTTFFMYDEGGHLIGEHDGSGVTIQEIVWMGDTPIASVRTEPCGLSIFYIHTDHLNTPRAISRRSTADLVWRWDSNPFGTDAPNENPAGLGVFSFNLRMPGQYFDQETGLNYNMARAYDSATGKYIESDPTGLMAGINTYAYVDSSPVSFFDSDGLGKEGGQKSIGGNDPAIPKEINRNSSPAEPDYPGNCNEITGRPRCGSDKTI
jgi:RHS repeat-associated protein